MSWTGFGELINKIGTLLDQQLADLRPTDRMKKAPGTYDECPPFGSARVVKRLRRRTYI